MAVMIKVNNSSKTLRFRAIIYIIVLIISGNLLFSQNLIIKIISISTLIFTIGVIFYDKEYREKYIPSMPNWLIIIIIIFFFSNIIIQLKIEQKPRLNLSNYKYDFGQIDRDTSYNGSIIIKNTGNSILNLTNVFAGCLCTKASLNKYNIQPGDTTLLTFTYKTLGKRGKQENYIIIRANTDSVIHILQVNANIK